MTQDEALSVMIGGHNVFLTGPPGSGKSYMINKFVGRMQSQGLQVAVTATTGIAANVLGGLTIHAWSGIGVEQALSDKKLAVMMEDEALVARLSGADVLIIDEISMLGVPLLEMLDKLLKAARSDLEPFGGIQVIFSGDFFQLPPVNQNRPGYAFESEIWGLLSLRVCFLSGQHRQGRDELLEILCALRERRFERRHLDALTARQGLDSESATKLMTHNQDVDAINEQRLLAIKRAAHSYEAQLGGKRDIVLKLSKTVLAPIKLKLKIGAKVMFVANDFYQGFANGSQGKVIGFKQGLPLVELDSSGQRIKVEPHTWRYVIDNQTLAEFTQIPLRLAWAITIHKSQGMSLDEADIDLTRTFTYGMGYVALSRIKNYSGLYLRGFNSRSLQLDPKVYLYYSQIEKEYPKSTQMDSYSDKVSALIRAGVNKNFIKLSLKLTDKQIQQTIDNLEQTE